MIPTDTLRAQFTDEIAAARTDRDLKAIRDRYLGRKGGAIAALMKTLASAPPEERPALGQAINALKREIEEALDARAAALAATARPAGAVDVTLPGRLAPFGTLHPLTQLRARIEAIFARQGYEILAGPETEDDWHNFEALNMPPEHPARDMQDTLYLAAPWKRPVPPVGAPRSGGALELGAGSGGASAPPDTRPATLLRTHTSAMQIRYMETHRPPVRVIAPGRVYRRDNLDLTHTPMFHQVEGLVVGEDVTMGDLKGTIIGFLRELFAPDIPVVFRPSFFPYTEPSADVFIGCQQCGGAGCAMCRRTGFIEVLGCGMVHPAVFEAVGYDPDQVTGFAFGVGIERLALLMYGVEDIRLFYENDLRFLEQFPL
ncbi:MAG TPA: phenylalanine--tRNA ligase subunit alpha [Vicinamibacterales bacterium]